MKSEALTNPVWNKPPNVTAHQFCADYYYDWVVCYIMGELDLTDADLPEKPVTRVVRKSIHYF